MPDRFTSDMRLWDEAARQHLESLALTLAESGLVDLVERSARVTFRTNLDRHEPQELFDSSGTLGFLSSVNLTGRLMSMLRAYGTDPLDGVEATMVNNTLEIFCGGATVHIIKAPSSPRREPSWSSFAWSERPTRYDAARRNWNSYRAPHVEAGIEPMFGAPGVSGTGLEACTDVFLVWSGDEKTGLTAGWLGLPTVDPGTWLAVRQLWWDQPEAPKIGADIADEATTGAGFLTRRPATPVISLRRHRATGAGTQ